MACIMRVFIGLPACAQFSPNESGGTLNDPQRQEYLMKITFATLLVAMLIVPSAKADMSLFDLFGNPEEASQYSSNEAFLSEKGSNLLALYKLYLELVHNTRSNTNGDTSSPEATEVNPLETKGPFMDMGVTDDVIASSEGSESGGFEESNHINVIPESGTLALLCLGLIGLLMARNKRT
ncbi:MAG: hypothetical protein COA99_01870 [Moraxellaceae bacterium]|nr:MAG: hypothetical protein COA99_01870 [Moraxellaceae bacterium]